MSVSDEAVEAAARAVWAATGHRESDWAYMAPETHRKERYMSYARAALEAAAPHMLAAAWDEGREADDFSVSIGFDANPYRSQP